jgi:hypothetical protein
LVWSAEVLQEDGPCFRKLGVKGENRPAPQHVALAQYKFNKFRKKNTKKTYIGIKQFVDVSSPIGVWSSGSNLQKNSSHSFFWYDTFEPLSVEITSSLKSGIKSGKSVVAYM